MNKSNNIILLLLLSSLTCLVLSASLSKKTSVTEKQITLIIEGNLKEFDGISQLAYHLQRAKSNLRELLLESTYQREGGEIEHARDVVLESIAGLEESHLLLKDGLKSIKLLGTDRKGQEHEVEEQKAKDILINIRKFIAGTKEILQLSKNTDEAKYYLALFKQNVEPVSRVLQKQINDYKLKDKDEVLSELKAVSSEFAGMNKFNNAIFLLILCSSILIVVFLIKNMRKIKSN